MWSLQNIDGLPASGLKARYRASNVYRPVELRGEYVDATTPPRRSLTDAEIAELQQRVERGLPLFENCDDDTLREVNRQS